MHPRMRLADLIPILQMAVGPVILISGIGLLILSLTNRYGRVIDRSRHLAREHRGPDSENKPMMVKEMAILARRARILRAAIAQAVASVLLAALLVISLFLGVLMGLDAAAVIVLFFVLCLGGLIGSMAAFLWDINLSLKALWMELPAEVHHRSRSQLSCQKN